MLSSVLRSKRAIQVNIAIMRAFVQLREMIASNKGLARRLNELEKKYDGQFRVVFEAIRELMAEPGPRSNESGSKPNCVIVVDELTNWLDLPRSEKRLPAPYSLFNVRVNSSSTMS